MSSQPQLMSKIDYSYNSTAIPPLATHKAAQKATDDNSLSATNRQNSSVRIHQYHQSINNAASSQLTSSKQDLGGFQSSAANPT